jgi:hypothetical protein
MLAAKFEIKKSAMEQTKYTYVLPITVVDEYNASNPRSPTNRSPA